MQQGSRRITSEAIDQNKELLQTVFPMILNCIYNTYTRIIFIRII